MTYIRRTISRVVSNAMIEKIEMALRYAKTVTFRGVDYNKGDIIDNLYLLHTDYKWRCLERDIASGDDDVKERLRSRTKSVYQLHTIMMELSYLPELSSVTINY